MNDITTQKPLKYGHRKGDKRHFVMVLSFMALLPGPGAASTAAPPRHAPRLPVPEAELGLASVRCPAHRHQEQGGQGEEGEVLHMGARVSGVKV